MYATMGLLAQVTSPTCKKKKLIDCSALSEEKGLLRVFYFYDFNRFSALLQNFRDSDD